MLPTNTEKKKELRKKFDHFVCFNWNCEHAALINNLACDQLFDFFYSEIETQKLADYKRMQDALLVCHTIRADSEEKFIAKLKAQEKLLKAADEVIECVEINTETHFFSINWKIKEALEKYTTLKQQQ